jgi:molybdenum cofactor cytidylyltransferase
MSDFHCAAVVLAAGASSRLGQPKQLIRIGGESLLRRATRFAAEAGCSPVYVVLGCEAERMRAELDGLSASIVIHPGWQEGMGSSLRAGMEAIRKADPQPESVLVLVCDQPRLGADHLRDLLARHPSVQGDGRVAITASVYAGRAGVPAVFSARLFPQLSASLGDRGARDLIQTCRTEVQEIPWPEGELDIDRPEDLNTIEPEF